MIRGTGIDIVELSRIAMAMMNQDWLQRIFSSEEISLFADRRQAVETIAGSFCAKEAVIKALSTGLSLRTLTEIQILRDPTGQPYAKLSGTALNSFIAKGANNIFISISHDKTHAIAHAIIEG